jgi:uncharacterized metal-binding protein YceD (DUF177 family)
VSESWHVPVRIEDIPESGRRFELEPNAATREVLARMAGLEALPRLHAVFDVTRHGNGLRVNGAVSARVRQSCVVTLEPIENDIEESVDVVFAPSGEDGLLDDTNLAALDKPEVLVGGACDLGTLATEFLVLGIDPYPRKPGAVFSSPSESDAGDHPFAALKSLIKSEDEKH